MNQKLLLFLFVPLFALVSCSKSYTAGDNSVVIDVYINGPMDVKSGVLFTQDDTLSLLMNLIDGKVPRFVFHRLDLADLPKGDSVSMSFFNGLVEMMSDKDDYKFDMENHFISTDLSIYLTKKGESGRMAGSPPTLALAFDSLRKVMINQGKEEGVKLLESNFRLNNGKCVVEIHKQILDSIEFDSAIPAHTGMTDRIETVSSAPISSQETNSTKPVKPIDARLKCDSGMNSPKWNSIPNAKTILLEVVVEGDIRNPDGSRAYGLSQKLNGNATGFNLSVKGGINSTRSFKVTITAEDSNGQNIDLKNNVLNNVHLSCSN